MMLAGGGVGVWYVLGGGERVGEEGKIGVCLCDCVCWCCFPCLLVPSVSFEPDPNLGLKSQKLFRLASI